MAHGPYQEQAPQYIAVAAVAAVAVDTTVNTTADPTVAVPLATTNYDHGVTDDDGRKPNPKNEIVSMHLLYL